MKTNQKQKNIPDGWKKIKLNNLCEKIGSGVTPRGGSAVYQDSGVLFLRSQNIQNGHLDISNPVFISEGVNRNMQNTQLQTNDVLYNITGASIGRSAVYQLEQTANVNQHVCIVRTKKSTSPYFINYWILSQEGERELYSFQAGGNREGLNFEQLGSFLVDLPPLPEQNRIVTVLETWDSGIDQLKQKIAIKKEIKKGLMQELLTGKKRLPGFRNKWVLRKLDTLFDIKRGGSPRPIQEFITSRSDGLNWLKIGDIKKGARYIESTSSKILKEGLPRTTLVKKGDFILSNSMSFGRPYISNIETCIHDGWLTFQNINDELLDANFLYYLLLSSKTQREFLSISAGSGVQNLKKETVAEVVLNFPCTEEQKSIAEILTTADNEITILEKKLILWQDQKKYLLNNLVTGQIRTPENLLETATQS